MNKCFRYALVLIVAFGLAAGARSQKVPNDMITLAIGEVKDIGDRGLQIGFSSILCDSRCPQDALCFWEGDAAAQIWADLPDLDTGIFTLHSHRSFLWQVEYDDYLIELICVMPYPKLDIEIDPREYEVTLVVTDVLAPAGSTTWGGIKQLLR